MNQDPTTRFSSRVADYSNFRPSYPTRILDLLKSFSNFTSDAIVADIGSGTGILSSLFLQHGNAVIGVEPNRAMRHEGEKMLARYSQFKSVEGSAEATSLRSESVDLIAAAQSFHWFDRTRSGKEFRRILRPGGSVTLIWNERCKRSSPFLSAYEDLLLQFGTDYREVDHSKIEMHTIHDFYRNSDIRSHELDFSQTLDLEGLQGRLLSSSYTPEAGHPNRQPMLAMLHSIFDRFSRNGTVTLKYRTAVHIGRLL